ERELRPGDVVVDIGAHVGVHALTAARRLRELGGGRVVAFEPAATAPMRVFDDWAAEDGLDRLDVVKLDVEGAELLALRGMRETLRRLRPRLVVVEVKDVVMQRGPGDEASLHALMAECGYVATGQVVKHNEVFRLVG
ncbi:MAG: hypothetical protein QOJ21_2211, partial [Solirubrobacteraceae bacterium]|nr:hypothetical protein [Solirubrobacteraceae bacterium]